MNLVTNRDKESQQLIFNHLSSLFPDHDFLAEEDLCEDRGSDFRWIIDPIDGTTNYAHSFPFFCISIALEWKGSIVLGVIYDPIREEMFTAVVGEGANLNGKRIVLRSGMSWGFWAAFRPRRKTWSFWWKRPGNRSMIFNSVCFDLLRPAIKTPFLSR